MIIQAPLFQPPTSSRLRSLLELCDTVTTSVLRICPCNSPPCSDTGLAAAASTFLLLLPSRPRMLSSLPSFVWSRNVRPLGSLYGRFLLEDSSMLDGMALPVRSDP